MFESVCFLQYFIYNQLSKIYEDWCGYNYVQVAKNCLTPRRLIQFVLSL